MKVETPQILWNSEGDAGINAALYGVSMVQSGFCEDPNGKHVPSYVLATAGNCPEIHLWKVVWAETAATDPPIVRGGRPTKIEFLCRLARHEGAVNCVKFSPDGLTLATAGDTGAIIMWSVPPEKRGNGNGQHFWSQVTREQDLHVRVIARSMEAVTDLSWSKDSQRLLAGAIDAAVFVLQARDDNTWHHVYRAKEHNHYVQGVAYDPLGVYFASMSNDRTVRVYTRKPPMKSKKKVQRKDPKTEGPIPSSEFSERVQQLLNDSKLEMQFRTKQIKHLKQQTGETTLKQTLFCDEATLKSFFRRLDWTPDGAFLVLPACLWPKVTGSQPLDSATVNTPANEAPAHAICLFARHHWEEPFRVLTGLEKVCTECLDSFFSSWYVCMSCLISQTWIPLVCQQPAVAIACNPVLFRLPQTDQENQPRAKLPYRSVMAVLTQDSVLIYDTVHTSPLAVMRGLHYANLTNGVWSADGQSLVVSSTDGYLSLVRFGPGELGEVYMRPTEQVTTTQATVSATPVSEEISCSAPPVPAPTTVLPPCEQYTKTVLEGRPAKKAKRITPTCIKRKTDDVAVPSVQDLSLVEPKKKKRIQPTLLTTTSQQ